MTTENYSVLVIYPKSHGSNAWLSRNNKTRWSKRRAQFYVKEIMESKTDLRGFIRAEIRLRESP